ncbi:hypothetical protein [Azotobacter beijerinckii]|uniref:Uncharacterized protein n=1 Tax=Azotobacter beijerinckii TaxID=170623 RepID=A0A1I0Z5X5_9GAMM|nr:hypothetical protein [Azotobacter beijerinckii]SFB19838.1 hypothetical protein SAMN04244571_01756 [Azotobacter beijerinckii]
MKKTTIKFVEIPTWAIPDKADYLALFETIALAGLEGSWIRLSAATQRAVIGHAVFGKQEFRVNADGSVDVCRSVCFGTDCEIVNYRAAELAGAVAQRLAVSPGKAGPRIYCHPHELAA